MRFIRPWDWLSEWFYWQQGTTRVAIGQETRIWLEALVPTCLEKPPASCHLFSENPKALGPFLACILLVTRVGRKQEYDSRSLSLELCPPVEASLKTHLQAATCFHRIQTLSELSITPDIVHRLLSGQSLCFRFHLETANFPLSITSDWGDFSFFWLEKCWPHDQTSPIRRCNSLQLNIGCVLHHMASLTKEPLKILALFWFRPQLSHLALIPASHTSTITLSSKTALAKHYFSPVAGCSNNRTGPPTLWRSPSSPPSQCSAPRMFASKMPLVLSLERWPRRSQNTALSP